VSRLRSLDIFRGGAVALMILVNNPGSWHALYPPLAHAPWHGCTPTDLVFPFFLFAVGNALALSVPGNQPLPPAFWRRVLRRTAVIFALGLFLNASPFVAWNAAGELVPKSWETLRVMGVLQRIALCYGAAAVIVGLGGRRAALGTTAVLLLGYAVLCRIAGMAGADGDPYSLQGWFGTAIDRALLGASHLYQGEGVPFDPEGLASTPPAIAQVLLGWWVGDLVRRGRPDATLVARLFLLATTLLAAAWLWQLELPLNKKIWTSSYVLHASGLAMMALAVLMHVVEGPARPNATRGWTPLLEAFGRNALFVFVLSGLVPRVLVLLRWREGTAPDGTAAWTTPWPWLYRHLFAGIGSDPRLGSLLQALALLGAYAAVVWWMDRRRLYIRA